MTEHETLIKVPIHVSAGDDGTDVSILLSGGAEQLANTAAAILGSTRPAGSTDEYDVELIAAIRKATK
jgi:hypothetical protein